jgi:hypothetical protein
MRIARKESIRQMSRSRTTQNNLADQAAGPLGKFPPYQGRTWPRGRSVSTAEARCAAPRIQ